MNEGKATRTQSETTGARSAPLQLVVVSFVSTTKILCSAYESARHSLIKRRVIKWKASPPVSSAVMGNLHLSLSPLFVCVFCYLERMGRKREKRKLNWVNAIMACLEVAMLSFSCCAPEGRSVGRKRKTVCVCVCGEPQYDPHYFLWPLIKDKLQREQ